MSTDIVEKPMPHVQLGENYTMKRPLATGGAARIFLARQNSLDRDVVIKVLRRQLSAQEEFRRRFAEEARLLARLEHPNIVQVIDFGEQDSYYYFVMEYVRGGSLRDLLERAESLPLDVALSIAYFTARGLAYVHDHHVLHLDIKPANILLNREGAVKVADFGLARLVDTQRNKGKSAHPAGTPLYMSPEQVQGAPLDARSDLFSFGIVLYQLLTSRTPFSGNSSDEVFREILNCRVDPPSQLREDVPVFVDNLVMTCLQRDRSLRFSHGNALIADLHTVLEKLGIHHPDERVQQYLSDPNHYRVILKKATLDATRPSLRARIKARVRKPLLTLALGAGLLGLEALLLTQVPALGEQAHQFWERLLSLFLPGR